MQSGAAREDFPGDLEVELKKEIFGEEGRGGKHMSLMVRVAWAQAKRQERACVGETTGPAWLTRHVYVMRLSTSGEGTSEMPISRKVNIIASCEVDLKGQECHMKALTSHYPFCKMLWQNKTVSCGQKHLNFGTSQTWTQTYLHHLQIRLSNILACSEPPFIHV